MKYFTDIGREQKYNENKFKNSIVYLHLILFGGLFVVNSFKGHSQLNMPIILDEVLGIIEAFCILLQIYIYIYICVYKLCIICTLNVQKISKGVRHEIPKIENLKLAYILYDRFVQLFLNLSTT